MKNTFAVTDLGLQVDKIMIMPGSELVLNAEPPAHWKRFGESGMAPADRKELVVATPPAGADSKTKKRKGLETQAGKLDIEFTDNMTDDELQAAIKAKKDAAK